MAFDLELRAELILDEIEECVKRVFENGDGHAVHEAQHCFNRLLRVLIRALPRPDEPS